MGVTVTQLTQVVPEGAPSLQDLGGPPHIAIVGAGNKRRHRFFLRHFEDLADVTVLRCLGQADAELRGGTLAQDLIAAAAQVPMVDGNRLNLFVDVSCLSRPAIAQVFAALPSIAQTRNVELRVGYSVAAYAPSPAVWATPNRTICPVHPAFSGWTSEGASAPLDIVVGLGYEKGKALGAVEYLEPRHRWICIPTSPEKAYLLEVEKHNRNLIDNSKERVAHYQVLSPVETYFSLRSMVEGIAREARPVMLPFGPKLFFAVSLLVALTVEESAVWHVSGESDEYSERSPSRYSAVLTCLICNTSGTSAVTV